MQKRMVKNIKLKICLNYRTSKEEKLSHSGINSLFLVTEPLVIESTQSEALWKAWGKLRRGFFHQADICHSWPQTAL